MIVTPEMKARAQAGRFCRILKDDMDNQLYLENGSPASTEDRDLSHRDALRDLVEFL